MNSFFFQRENIDEVTPSNPDDAPMQAKNIDCSTFAKTTTSQAVGQSSQPTDTILNNEPNQPKNYDFPLRKFGKETTERSFQVKWFDKFNWIHYDQEKGAAFCFVCINAEKKNIISATKSEHVFTKYGFTNWKKALKKNKGFLSTKIAILTRKHLNLTLIIIIN